MPRIMWDMCDHAEGNVTWIVRDPRTRKPITSAEGYTYYFAEEAQARALVERLGRRDLELVQTREPGA